MKVLIIDDEANSHTVLRAHLEAHHPDINVLASAFNVKEGVDLTLRLQPDLLFLDIEMPDGLGFDLLKKVGAPSFQVIFITAHEQYARTAIKFGALDYLMKPIQESELAEALQRARERSRPAVSPDQLAILWETLRNLPERKLPSRLSIPTVDEILYKPVEDIIWMEAQQNYTEFNLVGEQKKIIASVNLGEYEELFQPYQEFMRVHRSYLVNLTYVDRYVKSEGGHLVMKDGTKIDVSRPHRDELLDRLKNL